MTEQEKWMSRAMELAERGRGKTSPNPVVGAVILRDGKVIGEGWHERCGGPHAEVNAIKNASNVRGAEMYVTLEPCSHFGRTPPCANLLIEQGIQKVYVGTTDPNPQVAGRGIELLRCFGVEVVPGVLETECRKQNEIFFKYIQTKTPFVVMKSAMTLDGKIASYTGDSKWITDENSRIFVHQMRNALTGIMVGIGTVLTDNPSLTTRLPDGRNPIRIIVDSFLRTPPDANVLHLSKGDRCIIATTAKADPRAHARLRAAGAELLTVDEDNGQINLNRLMKQLGALEIDSILLEGGGTLNFSALKAGIVDRAAIFIAPKFIGGTAAKTPLEGAGFPKMSDAIPLTNTELRHFDQDFLILGDPVYPKHQ